ncbi:hypothetical protein [Clavibacter sp. MX14-G9D]|uniref:hypothetical protein n=1 Tax=Clavibacter sp. MX14-G9D TaxID=3064656 RepID=UPI00293E3596|nr:hypothetical protein [Clavibacter sp. MX14-G9D]
MLVATIDHGGTMTDPDDDAGDDEVGPDAEWGRLVGEVGQATIGDPRIARLVFVPAAVPHPFEDAVEVVERAAAQLLHGSAERPVAFLGYHAMNRLTRSREAVGFLVTDRAVHVRDAPSGVILRAPVRRIPLVRGPEGAAAAAAATVATAAGGFAWQHVDHLLPPDARPALLGALERAVALTLEHDARTSRSLPAAVPRARGLVGRIAELGLGDVVRLPDDPRHRKHMARLTKALALPEEERILFTVTDQTLGGPYGVVVTGTAIRSKDLMEEPVATPIAGLDPTAIRVEGARLHVGDEHTLPAHLEDAQRTALETLLREHVGGALDG